ncbi:hypothetical protein [Polyangium mundeleinium]|uniref:PE-PGRS family protein n=1 Tax=Polyangium mundeleinium TaxID=2995306 RepID=A0ABT5F647_9BACT|nr:hypothetical protein [Polyangium mundeleinium]MDC0749584.1 hypothetical protein [Polyangium mundeleinium]
MRDAWTWWRGVAVLVMAQAIGCLSLSTGDGGPGSTGGGGGSGGSGGSGGLGGLDGVPGGGAGGTGGDESGAVTASSSSGATSSSSSGAGGGGENGQSCIEAPECLSGVCVDGVCCDSACNGTCVSCARPTSLGTCTSLPLQEEDPGSCTLTMACDGKGACKFKNGQACNNNSECLSNNCGGGAPKICMN